MAIAAANFSSTSVYSDVSGKVTSRDGSRVSSFCSFSAGRPRRRLVCRSASGGGGCCGGSGSSGSSSGSGSCSSHGKSSLSNLGKEFEHMVATNTLLEFEQNYVSAPMEGKITRDIINTVMETYPEKPETEEGQKFLDINEILEEAKSMSNGNLVFSEDPDFVFV